MMTSFNSHKPLGRRLLLISAGILLYASNNAFAAEFVGDAQMRARDLLSRSIGGQAKIVKMSPAISTDGGHAFNLDPQEQARQLILGKRNFSDRAGRPVGLDPKSNVAPPLSVQGLRRADGQELARRMLLGVGA